MRVSCLVLSSLLGVTTAVQAADSLAPGKPSGVTQAQDMRGTVLLVGGGILAVAGFAFLIAATEHDKNTPLTIGGGNSQVGSTGTSTATTTTTTT